MTSFLTAHPMTPMVRPQEVMVSFAGQRKIISQAMRQTNILGVAERVGHGSGQEFPPQIISCGDAGFKPFQFGTDPISLSPCC